MTAPMTTEYRPLLTADAVIAARDVGEAVQFSYRGGAWLNLDAGPAFSLEDFTFGSGYRYRARPAGEDSRMVEFVEAGMRSGRSPADPIDPNEKFLVTDVHCCCGNVVRVLHDTCQRAKTAEMDTLRANHEELVRQFHAMEDERNAAEARAARLEELLRAMRVAAEAMPEYLPRIQKCRPAKSGFMAYMGQKAETCQGEEYGYVHKGRVIEILNRAALGPGGGA